MSTTPSSNSQDGRYMVDILSSFTFKKTPKKSPTKDLPQVISSILLTVHCKVWTRKDGVFRDYLGQAQGLS